MLAIGEPSCVMDQIKVRGETCPQDIEYPFMVASLTEWLERMLGISIQLIWTEPKGKLEATLLVEGGPWKVETVLGIVNMVNTKIPIWVKSKTR